MALLLQILTVKSVSLGFRSLDKDGVYGARLCGVAESV